MDTDVLTHTSLSEEKLGELETAHMPGPHVICGILSQCVRNITGEKVYFFKTRLDNVIAFYPGIALAVAPGTHTTEMGANLTD